jgi:6,7-dimethyl-8-ribityllumazine synthase
MPHHFAIVCSTYHSTYAEGLLAAATEALRGHTLTVVRVPGAFEIPLQVQRLARQKKFDAVLAFGVVWQGQTAHAHEILRAVTDSLMHIGLEHDTPILHEVLSIKTEAEAKARCLGKKLNRGTEAAVAALSLVALTHPSPKKNRH